MKVNFSAGPSEATAQPAQQQVPPTATTEPLPNPVLEERPEAVESVDYGTDGKEIEKKPSSVVQSPKSSTTSTVDANTAMLSSQLNKKPSTSSGHGQASEDEHDDELSEQIKTEGGECKSSL